jgi:hypothetical protein
MSADASPRPPSVVVVGSCIMDFCVRVARLLRRGLAASAVSAEGHGASGRPARPSPGGSRRQPAARELR